MSWEGKIWPFELVRLHWRREAIHYQD